MREEPVINPVQPDKAGRMAAVRQSPLAVGTHRRIPLCAFGAGRRTLPRQGRWQRRFRR